MSSGHNGNISYKATGHVANIRLSPLLPSDWIDATNQNDEDVPDFLWENAPRHETRDYRDKVKAYSHLPNGSNILDCKWALGRLLSDTNEEDDPLLATLETHCFRGLDGFESFGNKVELLKSKEENCDQDPSVTVKFPDILDKEVTDSVPLPKPPSNMWVVKDAMSNGAGGIWVVGPENAEKFSSQETSPLYQDHRYVAQRYVWPPLLFDGRKCHVRVYGLFTSDGRAFIHKRAFLHVANDPFTTNDGATTGCFKDSIHITNCCANSHDNSKFAGEILADFEENDFCKRDGETVVPLADFFPSIKACVSTLAKRSFPFLQGGQANNGFEYLGMDFMLSYNDVNHPVAYILEVNAPPSQDTATGLPHAENLHNEVIRDLTKLWVIPSVTGSPEVPGGWRCVHTENTIAQKGELIAPSKASILNKIRWAIFERKAIKKEKHEETLRGRKEAERFNNGTNAQRDNGKIFQDVIPAFARSKCPYFSDAQLRRQPQVFFENAGGSQVAQSVIDAMVTSLSFRHRSLVGTKTKAAARKTFLRILGAKDGSVFLGPNATSLLASLADVYVKLGLLNETDEIVLSTESHLANFEPWIHAANASGTKVKLWTPFSDDGDGPKDGMECSTNLNELINHNTRIVALPHASNVLGQIRDIQSMTRMIKTKSCGHAHVVVDGVAAVPHHFADLDCLQVDWYVVSCHKLFGPHLGGLIGRQGGAVEQLSAAAGSSSGSDEYVLKLIEKGTGNYEACAGMLGLGSYFSSLASFDPSNWKNLDVTLSMDQRTRQERRSGERCSENAGLAPGCSVGEVMADQLVSFEDVKEAYRRIHISERPMVETLLWGLRRSRKVRIIEGEKRKMFSMERLPTVCLIHNEIPISQIIAACDTNGIVCRCSTFLCTEHLARDFSFDYSEGVLRVSLAHYNTVHEIQSLIQTLESIPGWY